MTHAMKGDMPQDGWIDRRVPAAFRPYLKLMRLDRPIGTWLLLWPGLWAIALAGDALPDWRLMALFAVGAVVMRGAGCTINDILDHKYDAKVERTAARPIPSGDVSVVQAALFLAGLLAIGLAVLVQLNPYAIMVGAAALALVFPYPLMKRITYWPQAWLGLTFNWAALCGWAAVTGALAPPAFLLYAAGFFWTLGYDTIYAHQDKDDDVKIGVKSAALALAGRTRPVVAVFYGLTIALLGAAGVLLELSWMFSAGLALAALHLAWQVRTVDINDSPNCLKRFKSNRDFGALVMIAILAGKLM